MSIFSKTPRGKIRREKYDLSYSSKFTMKTGLLYPVYCEEVAPGDIFRGGSGFVVRSTPTVAPVMSNYYFELRYFYVPNRLVWPAFTEFMMDQSKDSAALEKPKIVHPQIQWLPDEAVADAIGPGTLFDFLNVPTLCDDFVNALPFRIYQLIWNEYFRDQNLQDPVHISSYDVDDVLSYSLLRVNWSKDYFNSALPWTQRGEDVDLPALVKLRDQQELLDAYGSVYQKIVTQGRTEWQSAGWTRSGNTSSFYPGMLRSLGLSDVGTAGAGVSSGNGDDDPAILQYINDYTYNNVGATVNIPAYLDPNGTYGVDVNIRDLRFATAIQRLLEKEALVGGGRYADWLRGIYGVEVGDSTLQRPLYLGGGRNGINISPVEQTSSTDSVSPQGTLAGKGYMSSMFAMNKAHLFAEHGWIMGVAFIRPECLYYRGLNRHMQKENRFDYLIPGFERLGEQEIRNNEVYNLQNLGSETSSERSARLEKNHSSFGYQSRQAEYKSHAGEVHGQIETDLAQYALSRGYSEGLTTPIALNEDFVKCNPDERNIFAVSPNESDTWIVDCRHVIDCFRNLKKYPTYGL